MVYGYFGQTTLPILKSGSRGPDVVRLQQMLTAAGYTTYGADGTFGSKTYNAVVKFQAAKGLKPDGVVGQATWAALMAAPQVASPPPAPAVVPAATPAQVVSVPAPTQSGVVGSAAHIIPPAPPPPAPKPIDLVKQPDGSFAPVAGGGFDKKKAMIYGGIAAGLVVLLLLASGGKKAPAMAGYRRRRRRARR